MTDQDELSEVRNSLGRWKESCIFYFKLDLALIGTIAAVVSYLKLESSDILLVTHEYRALALWLMVFLVYALLFELNITNTANRADLQQKLLAAKWRRRVHMLFGWAYTIQVVAHTLFIVGAVAYLLGYSDGLAGHNGNQ